MVKVGRDYGMPLVLVGGLASLVGLALGLWRPMQQVWVGFGQSAGSCDIRLITRVSGWRRAADWVEELEAKVSDAVHENVEVQHDG